MEKIIKSSKHGEKTIYFDEEDLWVIEKYNWHLHKTGHMRFYIRAGVYSNETKKSKGIYLHRTIMNAPIGMEVDHRDHNPLNNRRNNLRIATPNQNKMNGVMQKRNTSGFKGVHLFKRDNTYQAYISIARKRKHGGYFKTAIEAAKKYNEMAIKYHGEFAYLNKIPNE